MNARLPGLILVIVLLKWPVLAARGQVVEFARLSLRPSPTEAGGLEAASGGAVLAPGAKLLVDCPGVGLGWTQVAGNGVIPAFAPANAGREAGLCRAIAVPADLTARTCVDWPVGVDLVAEVDSVGPGGQGVWIRAGSNQGVQVGNAWWERQGGQPAARYEVRYVSAELSYCEFVPLSADTRAVAGGRVSLWPAPRDREAGVSRSAVCFVDARDGGVVVWIAAPPHADAPADAHVEFTRAGRHVGHGRVDRRDGRFWYVRLVPEAAGGADPTTTTGPATRSAVPASLPAAGRSNQVPAARAETAGSKVGAGEHTRRSTLPMVGDDALIRTRQDIVARRFVARVFAVSEQGPLIDAGETEQIAVGDELPVWRDGREIDRAVVRATQRTYAALQTADEAKAGASARPAGVSGGRGDGFLAGDEIRWQAPAPEPTVVGEIEQILDADLFNVRLRPGARAGIALAIVDADLKVLGVAIVPGAALPGVGFVIPGSSCPLLQRGMQLVAPAPAAEGLLAR